MAPERSRLDTFLQPSSEFPKPTGYHQVLEQRLRKWADEENESQCLTLSLLKPYVYPVD